MAEIEMLSDEKIDLLLKEAEARLNVKALQTEPQTPSHRTAQHTEQTEVHKRTHIPKLQHGLSEKPYIQEKHGVANTNPRLLANVEQKRLADRLRTIDIGSSNKKTNDVVTAGPEWFDIPKTVVTPKLKRDLQMIELRSVLDPHRHYKKNNRKGQIPIFSQTGTVIEGPTEWYSARINKKDRTNTFVEEAIATEKKNGRFRRKYNEIQTAKTSGKKAHYQKLMQRRGRKS